MDAAFIFDPDSPPTPTCHAPTIAVLPDRLAAAWFAGTREGDADVGIWTALRRDGRWERPRRVADGDGEPCWNPVLAVCGETLRLFYKVGPSPSRWRGAVLDSVDGGATWRPGPALPPGFLGPIKNKPLELAGGALLCPSSREDGGWRCHFELLPANPERWLASSLAIALPDPGNLGAIQPTVFPRATGFEALARTKSGCIARARSADGRSWTPLERTPLPNPNSGIDAAAMPDGRIAIVYNPVATPPGRWGGPRTPLALAVGEADGGWADATTLEADPGEFSYPAIVCADDRLHIVYTWRRRTIKHVETGLAALGRR